MYRIWLVNFGWYLEDEYEDLGDAIAKAKSTSYECRIDGDDKPIASWSIFGGLRYHNRPLPAWMNLDDAI